MEFIKRQDELEVQWEGYEVRFILNGEEILLDEAEAQELAEYLMFGQELLT